MNKKILIIAAAATLLCNVVAAQDKTQIKWYGFIRNYFAFDTREGKSGTADMFYYLPLDTKIVGKDVDVNANPHFSYTAITSRLGLDVSGYELDNWKFGAKIEADFYAGLSGVTGTATFRLRQAYLTATKNDVVYKVGQAWHPMAADFPDVFSLNTGAPFGPFNRSPLVQMDYKIDQNYSLTAAAIWQMQYTSAGPNGASADYMKYSMTPELFLGLNWKRTHFSSKVGVNVLSIKPRNFTEDNKRAKDKITTIGGFAYFTYAKSDFSVKSKIYYGQGGEHLGLNSGYARVFNEGGSDTNWYYTPFTNLSSWVSLKYGTKVQAILFAGYVKNFGTKERIADRNSIYFSKNSFSNMNQMYRITPAIVYNFGKITIGVEYEMTSVQYGKWDDELFAKSVITLRDLSAYDSLSQTAKDYLHGLATTNLHWVTNNRIQVMLKYTF